MFALLVQHDDGLGVFFAVFCVTVYAGALTGLE
jgi:hypothetical protein